MFLSGKTVRCFENRMLWLCVIKKKRNGKRNSIERKKPNSLSRIPSPAGINTDLSSWPSLWLSSCPPCHRSRLKSLEEDRRNGAAAVRVTRISCLFPDRCSQKSTELQQQWLRKDPHRTIPLRHSCGWWGSGELLLGNRVSCLKFSGEKTSKGSFVPSRLNVLQKMNMLWYSLRTSVKQLQIVVTGTLHSPFLSRLALPWGYFMCNTKVWALSGKWMLCCWKEHSWITSVLSLEWSIRIWHISKCLRKSIRRNDRLIFLFFWRHHEIRYPYRYRGSESWLCGSIF